jgi:sporulation protein YlmC with PRC-barrel domain
MNTVRLEDLVGLPVRDVEGRRIGRLEEARVREEGGEALVVDYLVGPGGWIERFSLARAGRELLRIFGLARSPGYIVPWDRMDLSVPARPRCTCRTAELRRA